MQACTTHGEDGMSEKLGQPIFCRQGCCLKLIDKSVSKITLTSVEDSKNIDSVCVWGGGGGGG